MYVCFVPFSVCSLFLRVWVILYSNMNLLCRIFIFQYNASYIAIKREAFIFQCGVRHIVIYCEVVIFQYDIRSIDIDCEAVIFQYDHVLLFYLEH